MADLFYTEESVEESVDLIRSMLDARQFAPLREMLVSMTPQDLSQLAELLPEKQMPLFYRLLPKELAAEVFVEMDSEDQESLIKAFSDSELKDILDELYLDDTVDIIEEMPASVVKRMLRQSDQQTREWVNRILQYPKDSVGSIMTIEYVDLKGHYTVPEAIARIRKVGVDKETIYTCYVTDNNRKLLGYVTAKDILLAKETDCIADIMDTNILYATTVEDKEEAVRMINRYDFLALPVVDGEGRLVGIVTVDDAMDVMEEEATEDIEKMAAIIPGERPYIKSSVWTIWRQRMPWLLMLMISATFTGAIISSFETALQAIPVLIAFIPMLMDTGGNAGSQASVTIIRSLALGDVTPKDITQILWKEMRISVLCGVVLAAANFLKIMLIDNLLLQHNISIMAALVINVTLVATVFTAKLVGSSLPILAKKIGFDPAVMASPFITTVVDAISLTIYFLIATALL